MEERTQFLRLIQARCLRGLQRLQRRDVEGYVKVQGLFAKSGDTRQSPEFQTAFKAYYDLRYMTDANSRAFFDLFEAVRRDPNPSFERTLETFYHQTGRVEPSFISKMLATLDPNKHVYDSQLRRALNLDDVTGTPEDKLRASCEVYAIIGKAIDEFSKSDFFETVEATFDKKFGDFSKFTPTKKVDLMLWRFKSEERLFEKSLHDDGATRLSIYQIEESSLEIEDITVHDTEALADQYLLNAWGITRPPMLFERVRLVPRLKQDVRSR